jgi:uncharacterized cupredoxin-like copper-binding protein
MSMSKRVSGLVLVTGLSLIGASCGGTGTESSTTFTTGEMEYSFGSPAEPADADRTIEIAALDSFAFDPAELKVTAGETVTFLIVNEGRLVHDFTLGDQATQDEHEAEMTEMEDMAHDQPNVVTIPAGETVQLTWTFTEAGAVLIGCHQLGHYAGGMIGQITVEV